MAPDTAPRKENQVLAILGTRQQALLKLLLKHKGGLTVDEIATALDITRNAVRQHLAALTNDGLLTQGATRPSGGRPEQLYVLTDAGKELFPRHYSWFAQLVVESIKTESGADGLRERLDAMGTAVAEQLRARHPGLQTRQQKVAALADVMEQLGYDTKDAGTRADATTIEADNCIFHNLAMKNPEVCAFDLALLSTFTDSKVDHQECMARGGNVCRFKFSGKR
jgi:predicted ArsR family transcriptional regulator